MKSPISTTKFFICIKFYLNIIINFYIILKTKSLKVLFKIYRWILFCIYWISLLNLLSEIWIKFKTKLLIFLYLNFFLFYYFFLFLKWKYIIKTYIIYLIIIFTFLFLYRRRRLYFLFYFNFLFYFLFWYIRYIRYIRYYRNDRYNWYDWHNRCRKWNLFSIIFSMIFKCNIIKFQLLLLF